MPLLLLLLAACAAGTHRPFDPGSGRQAAAPATSLAAVSASEPVLGPETVVVSPAPSFRGRDTYRFHAPSQGDNAQPGRAISGRYYRAPGNARRPLVVLLPIWGASTYPQQVTLKHLLSGPWGKQLDVLTIDGKRYLFDWPAMSSAGSEAEFFAALSRSVAAYETTLADVRRIVRWAADRRGVDPGRIAVVGYSVSAMMAVTLMAREPQLHSAALVITGARMAEVMSACPRRPARARRNLLDLTGWARGRYTREVAARVAAVEPLTAAPHVEPASVLFIDAAADACMPEAGREALWNALGRPARLTLPQNHRNAFLTMTILGGFSTTRHIARFLEQRLFELARKPSRAVAAAGLD